MVIGASSVLQTLTWRRGLNSVARMTTERTWLDRFRATLVAVVGMILVCPFAGMSAEVRTLYESQVEVADKSNAARKAALSEALLEVAIKVSGEKDLARNSKLADALKSADRYLQQYRYIEDDAPSEQRLALWAQFDPTEVNRSLEAAGLPVWGRTRPTVLAWIAVEVAGGRTLVGADDQSGVSAALQQRALERGIPVLIPLLDLEDRTQVDVTDLWGGFRGKILQASARYGSEAVMVARAYRRLPTLWEVRWLLFLGDAPHQWTTQGPDLRALMRDGIDELTEVLVDRFVRSTAGVNTAGQARMVEFSVTGIHSLEDYARALRYLQSLDGVARVEVTRVEVGEVVFGLAVRGGGEGVVQVIALGQTLTPIGIGGERQYRLEP